MSMDGIQLTLFANQLDAICDEMGILLKRAAFSPNIKDRLDFSCALFDARGELCAQAAHIPVHLGSMAYAMRSLVSSCEWQPGDRYIVNDPYAGGTHLPDMTVIAPVFSGDQLVGFVANRAHHADVGSDTAGSMPIATHINQEGVRIVPQRLISSGQVQQSTWQQICQQVNTPHYFKADIHAQLSACEFGLDKMTALVESLTVAGFEASVCALNAYAKRMAGQTLNSLPFGTYCFSDYLDDDGVGNRRIKLNLQLKIDEGAIIADFSGSASQVAGNLNCPLAVTAAAVFYVFRCLMPSETPSCAGAFSSIQLQVPGNCVLNARYPAAVAAGNVETSSRVVDVVLGALAEAIPERIPAASHGSMNNLACGHQGDTGWDYYETMGGGMGASQHQDGLDGVQTHMTNTLNTPIESLEMHYPLRVNRYAYRSGSGGKGVHAGGDGLIREIEFLSDATVSLITERRQSAPWGLWDGEPGQTGSNLLNGAELPAKVSRRVQSGDRITLCSAGGGGWGKAK